MDDFSKIPWKCRSTRIFMFILWSLWSLWSLWYIMHATGFEYELGIGRSTVDKSNYGLCRKPINRRFIIDCSTLNWIIDTTHNEIGCLLFFDTFPKEKSIRGNFDSNYRGIKLTDKRVYIFTLLSVNFKTLLIWIKISPNTHFFGESDKEETIFTF